MTHAEWLREELTESENAYKATHTTNPDEAFFWSGYINAINNALNNLNGMEEN